MIFGEGSLTPALSEGEGADLQDDSAISNNRMVEF